MTTKIAPHAQSHILKTFFVTVLIAVTTGPLFLTAVLGQSQAPVPLINLPLVPDAAMPGGAAFTPSTQGQAVTFTAKITSPTVVPTGPVTFKVGNTVLGTAQLSAGKATFTTSTLPVGATIVTVTYPWNSNIASSSASVTQTVGQ